MNAKHRFQQRLACEKHSGDGSKMMNYMLCRNRVRDAGAWRAIFNSHRSAQENAGLYLRNIWSCVEDQNNVFFLFEVISLEDAKRFINDPEAAKAGAASGVLDGEYHLIQEFPSHK